MDADDIDRAGTRPGGLAVARVAVRHAEDPGRIRGGFETLMLPMLSALVALLACACSRGPSTQVSDPGATLMDRCPLNIRDVRDDGSLVDPPIIRPEHVEWMSVLDAPASTIGVILTPEGEQRMLRFTRSRVGRSIAVFCGAREVARVLVSQPLGRQFQVSVTPGTP
jgi:hypothetical protein